MLEAIESQDGSREIYRIYLGDDLPYDPALVKEAGGVKEAIDKLVSDLVEQQFAHRDENRFLEVTLRSDTFAARACRRRGRI